MKDKVKLLQAGNIFHHVKYKIPIYQRNYAWGEVHIQQLIDDIYTHTSSDSYYLGTLIVDQKDTNLYEVIDGQQRLTTLYLLETFLEMNILKEALTFEAREKSNRTLSVIGTEELHHIPDELKSEELIRGFQMIKGYFHSNKIDQGQFKQKLSKVQLIRIQVPEEIDLNHYFEMMNTRGEQLELHEIAKAKLLSKLNSKEDKKTGALIWESCSNMNSYIQMNVDLYMRKRLFSKEWSLLDSQIDSFDKVRDKMSVHSEDVTTESTTKSLLDILTDENDMLDEPSEKAEENERFKSIIIFPHFILQVNQVISENIEDDSLLDDKHFLNNIKKNWCHEESAKNFLFHLFKCRVLFDQFILKRELANGDNEERKWSLQRIKSYKDWKNNLKPSYVSTIDGEEGENKRLRTLQSCLRITYTSPKTMHWISIVLKAVMKNNTADLLKILEAYCQEKIKTSGYEQTSGFDVERIVFTYLDYILYRDGYSYKGKRIIDPLKGDWQFQFRNSIEHFNPQNPVKGEMHLRWGEEEINSFGNLALITVSGNSKFSNLPPSGKIHSYPSVIKQSLKLKIMEQMMALNKGKWDQAISDIHRNEMFRILSS
ncbi:DUF262 domain-containing protein [Bacillus altitudinis]